MRTYTAIVERCLYVEFKAGPGAETREVLDGLNVALAADGSVVGFDIDHASRRADRATLETEAPPLRSTRFDRPVARGPGNIPESSATISLEAKFG